MHLKYFEQQFQKRNIQVNLNPGLSEEEIELHQIRLKIILPKLVRIFYAFANGYEVKGFNFIQLPIENWIELPDGMIQFMTIENKSKIGWDVTHLNDANEWDILNCITKNRITLTMTSLWSNKIWKWFDRKKEFWNGEV